MGHYAIALKYNFDPDSSDGEITEYFVPYTIEELSGLELNQFTKTAIKRLHNRTSYPLDHFVQKNGLEESRFIELLEDDEIHEIEEQKISFADGSEDAYTDSLWNLLSDANLVYEASQNHMENKDYIDWLATTTVYSQYELLRLKIEVSLLLHFEHEEYFETPYFSRERSQQGVSIDNIYDVFDFYREAISASEGYSTTSDFIERWTSAEQTSNYELYEVETRIRDICALCRINNTLGGDNVQRQGNQIAIRVLCDELLKELWKPFDNAYYYHEVIKAVLHNEKTVYRRKNFESFVKFIDEKVYYSTSDSSVNRIEEDISGFQDRSSVICSGDYSPTLIWASFSDFFGSSIANSEIRRKYSGKGYGCFSLLITDSDKHYFAISGVNEELKPKAGKLEKPVSYIMEHILNRVPAPDILAHNYTFNFAYINPNLDVRRYTEIIRDTSVEDDEPKPYLLNGYKTFASDYMANPTENYNLTYSCCERKMLAYAGYAHAVKIFSRWTPCWKCCPAILDAPNVEVYAFTTLADFRANNRSMDMTLKKYKVERNLSYSVQELPV